MATWNTAFETSPADGDNPSAGAGKIRELKVEVGDRGNREHTWAGTTAADGIHRAGSAKVYFTTATPTLQPDGVTTLTTTDKGRLYYKSSTGSILLIHNGTGFVSTGVTLSTSQTIRGEKTFTSLAGNAPSLKVHSGGGVATTRGVKLLVFSIGSWNMAGGPTSIAASLTRSRVRGLSGVIRRDGWDATGIASLEPFDNDHTLNNLFVKSNGVVVLRGTGYTTGGAYNSTGFNRGYVNVWYSV